MSTYFGISSGAASSLFSSLNGTSSNTTSSLFGDYASIKNGSYKKLLKSYYTQNNDASKQPAKTTQDTEADKKQLTLLKNDSTDLYKASQKLVSSTMKDDKENLKNVKAFVEAYNNMIDSTDNSESKTVTRNTDAIKNATKLNSEMLANVGITFGSDNKLKLDEDVFNDADDSEIKTLFKGQNSYASGVMSRTSNIYTATVSDLNKNSGYDSTGKYKNIDTIGNLYNTLF